MIHKLAAILTAGAVSLYGSYKLGKKAQQEFGVPETPKTVPLEQFQQANPTLKITPLNPESNEVIIPIVNPQQSSFNWIDRYFDDLVLSKLNLLSSRIQTKFMSFIGEILSNIIPAHYYIYIYWGFIIVLVYFCLKIVLFVLKVLILEVKWVILGIKKIFNFLGYTISKNKNMSVSVVVHKPKLRRFRQNIKTKLDQSNK